MGNSSSLTASRLCWSLRQHTEISCAPCGLCSMATSVSWSQTFITGTHGTLKLWLALFRVWNHPPKVIFMFTTSLFNSSMAEYTELYYLEVKNNTEICCLKQLSACVEVTAAPLHQVSRPMGHSVVWISALKEQTATSWDISACFHKNIGKPIAENIQPSPEDISFPTPKAHSNHGY